MSCTTITVCRACGSASLAEVLSLGRLPLANALVDPNALPDIEPRYPLETVRCAACGLLQLTVSVAPEVLFRRYVYFSSYSDAFLSHAEALVAEIVARRRWGPASRVVEVGSNDGYLLQFYRRRGIAVLGIDPAENVADVARQRGVETIAEFFDAALARRLREGGVRADVVHANNVLAHVSDPRDLLAGMRTLLAPGGLIVVEVPYLVDLVDGLEFDTIYHEHQSYFSLGALRRAFAAAGLAIADVQRLPVHGGSLRLYGCRAEDAPAQNPAGLERVEALAAQEMSWGVGDPRKFQAFAAAVGALAHRLRDLLTGLRRTGARLAAYGASAKGAVLLNFCGIGRDLVDCVFDRSPHKQGLLMPGTHQPIAPADRLCAERPDYLLLLAWNFAEEIMAQQKAYGLAGGRFVRPVPEPRVLAGGGPP